jgi:UDP-N-acetylmuramoylalanine--D-glutamate ligase
MAAVDDGGIDAFVVECSSFRLQFTETFRCDASTWLNLAPDHLDWHPDLGHYAAAKARIWAHVRPGDVAVVPHGNTLIAEAAVRSGARVVSFGLESGDYRVESGSLVGPRGLLCAVSSMWRSMPHDLTNSLAAAALVLETGLVPESTVAESLAGFSPAHHRIELVGTFGGSRWFDDSKATSPHAALTAIRAFPRLVLIAGGRNKGLDLSEMASEPARMHAVVAMGDDAALIEAAFRGTCTVRRAGSMQEAVAAAAELAEPGVDVVLSPGCTSYDWYRNYNERGDDYQAAVRRHFGEEATR